MKIESYYCKKCNKIFDHFITDTEMKEKGFPKQIKCECGAIAKRKFSGKASHVKIGKCGNYKNGYASSEVYIKKC